jgi:hypothetical protein
VLTIEPGLLTGPVPSAGLTVPACAELLVRRPVLPARPAPPSDLVLPVRPALFSRPLSAGRPGPPAGPVLPVRPALSTRPPLASCPGLSAGPVSPC